MRHAWRVGGMGAGMRGQGERREGEKDGCDLSQTEDHALLLPHIVSGTQIFSVRMVETARRATANIGEPFFGRTS